MPFTELLADSEFPAQGVFFIIVLVFSLLKWLFKKLTDAKNGDAAADHTHNPLEDLYERYRDEIHQRQSHLEAPAPPELPQQFIQQNNKPVQQPVTPKQAKHSSPLVSHSSTFPPASTAKKRRRPNKLYRTLRSKQSLQQAIIAKEILGPPKALES